MFWKSLAGIAASAFWLYGMIVLLCGNYEAATAFIAAAIFWRITEIFEKH